MNDERQLGIFFGRGMDMGKDDSSAVNVVCGLVETRCNWALTVR